jgi:hypothetical protein
LPHEVLDWPANASHVPPLQQPGHDPVPQLQVPDEQESPVPHAAHAAPPVPHWLADCAAKRTHVLPLQQPLAHEVASQTHWPLALHSVPEGHVAQVAPPVPHEIVVSLAYASHVPVVPPLQQPFGHVFASHEHRPSLVSHKLFAQAAQATPPAPQIEEDCEP